MARSAILGNGGLTVGIDEKGLVHDFYFPFVGLENLNSARANPHYVGVWVDGSFSWLHEEGWTDEVKLHEHAMVTQSRHKNNKLGVSLSIESFVDYSRNTFVRRVIIKNLGDNDKEVRLFFHQAFQISSEGRSDTALYVPDDHYILDYKGRCVLLIKAAFEDGTKFDQYAVGNYGIEGKDGTYKDAEDGELSLNAVEHAGVDSVIRLSCVIGPGKTKVLDYWVSVSDSHAGARKQSRELVKEGVPKLLHRQIDHWQNGYYQQKISLAVLARKEKRPL